ncbi:MAG: DoxX family protein [Eudoraea sp.]|nr:DoxX family protein [Eudoraea sp.]
MKYIVSLSRILVGVLFIMSGLIKLNDPVGFSFKLEEYFSQGVLDLPFFMPYALAISIFVVILEVVLGVFLLLGYQKKFTLWSLLLMIVFFTFLTFYSAYFNKVTDCGCFGDAIKLTPWESFTKDVVLLVLIIILFAGQRLINPILSVRFRKVLVLISVVLCVFYAYYVLNHLPQIDFRPYKIGANIEEGMTVPEDAPKAIFEYAWKFDVGGEEKVIVTNGAYPTVDGEFIDVETTEIQKGYEPPIHDFTIEQDGEDLTGALLNAPKLVMVVAYDLRKTNSDAFKGIKKMSDEAKSNDYKVIGLSASDAAFSKEFAQQHGLDFEFYFTDETALKTIIRSNPGVLVLSEGTILQKVHYNDVEDLHFNKNDQ